MHFYNFFHFVYIEVVNCCDTNENDYNCHYNIEPDHDLLNLNLQVLSDEENVVFSVVFFVDFFDFLCLIFRNCIYNSQVRVLLFDDNLEKFVVQNFIVTNFYNEVKECYLHLVVLHLLRFDKWLFLPWVLTLTFWILIITS